MMNRDMKTFLASLVTGEMSVIQAAWINKDAMLNSLHVQEEAQQSLLHYGSKKKLVVISEVYLLWYWNAVFPREISVAQRQQECSPEKWFISGQLILSKSLKKSQKAIVSEHINCSMLIIRILHCSEKKVWFLSSNDTFKNYNIQWKNKASFLTFLNSGMFLFEILG